MGNFSRRQMRGGLTLPQIARGHTEEAIELLVEVMRDAGATTT